MRNSILIGVGTALLAGCGSGVPDPTQADAQQALRSVLQSQPLTVWFGPAGTPENCSEGQLNGVPIRSCKVCNTHMQLVQRRGTYGVSHAIESVEVRRVNLSINFKRAISYDQPEIAPADGAPGVWVAAFATPPSPFLPQPPPTYEFVAGRSLTPEDPLPSDIVMQYGSGELSFSIQRPGYRGNFANNNVLLEWLATPEAIPTYTAIVGTCDGPVPEDSALVLEESSDFHSDY